MKQLLCILLLIGATSAQAYDFEVDGIFYNILESELWEHENPIVEVTFEKAGGRKTIPTESYVNDMVIPAYVTWEGTEYQVIGIGYSAFSFTGVWSVEMPEGLEYIDNWAFFNSGLSGHVKLPSTMNSIGQEAFGFSLIESIIIPNSVEYMGDYVFEDCPNLRYAVLSANQKEVPLGTFENCERLQEVIIPEGIESIGSMAFHNTSVRMDLPRSLIRIDNDAFSSCNFSGVFLPYNVEEMGTSVFYNCTWLTYASIPKKISKIPDYTFYNCYSLKNVTIPKNIREIGNYAFFMPRNIVFGDYEIWWGSDLTTVYIMGDVNYIGRYAFGRNDGTSLDDFYCYSSIVPQADSTAFSSSKNSTGTNTDHTSCIYNATLHVPASLIHEYQNTFPWSQFARIVSLTDNIRPVPEPQKFASYRMSELRGYSIDSTCYYLYNTQTKSFFCYDRHSWNGKNQKWTAHLGAPATKVFFLRYPQHIFDGSVKICFSGKDDYSWVTMGEVDNDVFMVNNMGGGVYRIGLSEHNRDFKQSLYPDCYMGFDQYEGTPSIGPLNYLLEPGKEPEGHTYCVDWKLVSAAEYSKIADQLYACSSSAYLKQLIDSTAIHHQRINVNKMETAYFDITLSGEQLDSVRTVLLTAVSLSEYLDELKVNYPTVDLTGAEKLLSRPDFTIGEIEEIRKGLDMAVIRTNVLAVIGGATEKNPKSATELITNPSFEKTGVWKMAYDPHQITNYFFNTQKPLSGKEVALDRYMEISTRNFNYAADCYPSLKSALGNGEYYNTLVGLPNGKYVLECDAAATNETDDVDYNLLTGVYLFVRSSGVETLTPITSNGMVPQHFANEFYISSGDTIYFGIKTANTTASHYAMDNFTLTYYGETDKEAYHGTLMSRLSTLYSLFSNTEQLYADTQLKQEFNKTYQESDIIVGDYSIEEYSSAMKAVEQKADALNHSVSNYINAALLRHFCEQKREHYAETAYNDLADQLGDLGMTLETGYLDCNLDNLLQETYHITIGEVYAYIQQLIAEATGIKVPLYDERNNAIYNLQGQRINGLQKGLNIVDGKKVFVR